MTVYPGVYSVRMIVLDPNTGKAKNTQFAEEGEDVPMIEGEKDCRKWSFLEKGDTISMEFDTDNLLLSFFINEKKHSVVENIRVLEKEKYYPLLRSGFFAKLLEFEIVE